MASRDLAAAAAEFVDAVQAERAMIARLYVETAAARAFYPPPPPQVRVAPRRSAQPWADAA